MSGIVLCIFAFALTYYQARKSLGLGLVSLLSVGYAYGLLRARVPDVATHFVYDVAMFALYAARFSVPVSEAGAARSASARMWTLALMVWPLVCMVYSPAIAETQPFLIQIVGLRDAAIALPFIVIATRLKRSDMDTLAPAVAILNLIALAFTLFEYAFGIESIIPRNAVTDIIYASRDIMGAQEIYFRLPSTFLEAHQYGGTMVLSIPFVVHGLESDRRVRILCWCGLSAAFIGTFLCGARLPVVMLTMATLYALFSQRMRASTFLAFGIAAAGISYLVVNLERLQRFTTLGDTDMVASRIALSVNLSFFEVLSTYPLGAGLASAFGTSIPYFLAQAAGVRPQFGIENEYGHILLEQGVIGLALWLAFIVYSTFRPVRVHETTPTSAAFMKALAIITWLVCLLGSGTMYGIPSATLLFVMVGMRLADPVAQTSARALRHVGARARTSSLTLEPALLSSGAASPAGRRGRVGR